PADEPAALGFLHALCDLVRFPTSGRRAVRFGDIAAVEPADLSLFGLQRDAPDLAWAEHCTGLARGSALFVLDSGRESARA
ncbi:MAG: hypothetical protein KC613_27900, partial [Myxococcales bacterium]|nr:hypothetical protein [Myxococcales bacterium]